MAKSAQTKRRLYECDECHGRQLVHWVELNRSSKPRCNKCGSTRLDPVAEEAKDEIVDKQRQRIEGPVGSMVLAGHVRGKQVR